jgi:hypothetical protein
MTVNDVFMTRDQLKRLTIYANGHSRYSFIRKGIMLEGESCQKSHIESFLRCCTWHHACEIVTLFSFFHTIIVSCDDVDISIVLDGSDSYQYPGFWSA